MDGTRSKDFGCVEGRTWQPSDVVPACVNDTLPSAAYELTSMLVYTPSSAVTIDCVTQYVGKLRTSLPNIQQQFSQRCTLGPTVTVRFRDTQVEVSPDGLVGLSVKICYSYLNV